MIKTLAISAVVLAVGADKARAASAPTIEAMYERMGFVRLAAR